MQVKRKNIAVAGLGLLLVVVLWHRVVYSSAAAKSPAFFVRKQFVMLWPDGHHEHDFPHLWCAAPLGAQDESVATDPGRYFVPPYVGARGWLGMRLDGDVDWDEVAERCEDAYRTVAPARLVARLDGSD